MQISLSLGPHESLLSNGDTADRFNGNEENGGGKVGGGIREYLLDTSMNVGRSFADKNGENNIMHLFSD